MQNQADTRAKATWNKHKSAANAAAQVVVAAKADEYWLVDVIDVSYSAAPSAGAELVVTIGSTEVFRKHISTANPPLLLFDRDGLCRELVVNEAVTVDLSAGGAGVTGTINVRTR